MSLFVKNNTDKSSLLENEYKRSVHRLVSLLNLYNPVKYTPEVLKASKEDWIQEVKEAFLYSSDFVFELEEIYSQDERMDAIRADNEALENEVSKFILDINAKVLVLDSTTIATDEAEIEKMSSKVETTGFGFKPKSRPRRSRRLTPSSSTPRTKDPVEEKDAKNQMSSSTPVSSQHCLCQGGSDRTLSKCQCKHISQVCLNLLCQQETEEVG